MPARLDAASSSTGRSGSAKTRSYSVGPPPEGAPQADAAMGGASPGPPNLSPSSNAQSPQVKPVHQAATDGDPEVENRPLLRSLAWLPRYIRNPETLKEDLLAGLTVGVMVVPQSMAYAMIAGLPPIYGLYSALVPPMVYAFIGDSRHLQPGPVSMCSLLTANAAKKAGGGDVTMYVSAAILLGLLAGLVQIGLGVCKLGVLVDFASRPVIAGFTSGASVVVIVTQVQHVFGVSVASGATSVHTLFNLVGVLQTQGPHWISLVLGVLFVAMLFSCKALSQRHPQITVLKAAGPLSIVVLGTLVVWGAQLDAQGVKIIKDIPSGMPALTNWGTVAEVGGGPLKALALLADTAIAIAFISFMESIAVTKTLARRHGYEKDIDANQELIALGASNAVGSLFQGYAGAGAFSRSAVASDSGARSQVAAMVNSLVVAVTLFVLTPAFYYLPKGVLSAIVIQAVWGLIDIDELRGLMRVCPRDAVLWIVAFCGTLHTVHLGIVIAVVVSILFVMRDASHPSVERLGCRITQTAAGDAWAYVPATCNEVSPLPEGVLAVQISGALYGSSSSTVRRGVDAADQQGRKDAKRHAALVLDIAGVPVMDSTALSAVRDLCTSWRSRGAPVAFAGANPRVARMLDYAAQKDKSGGREGLFPSVSEAVEHVRAELHADAKGKPDYV